MKPSPIFELGRTMATSGALAALAGRMPMATAARLLTRHQSGDWGSVCAEDAATNNESVPNGSRILSAYPIDPAKPCKGYGDNCLWIITEADRSTTTILLPEEY